MTPVQAADTLYKRLGGYDAIAGFVDTAFPRVAINPQLTHLFRGHSVESQRRQRQLIVDALCEATGGPCLYTGREMKPVHVGLGITDEQWNTFMTIISSTAAERKFGEAERKEFLACSRSDSGRMLSKDGDSDRLRQMPCDMETAAVRSF